MKKAALLFFFTFPLLTQFSCRPSYQTSSVKYFSYKVSSTQKQDENILRLLKPYSDSVNRSMNDVLGVAEYTLEAKRPESTLGNFIVDAYFFMAKEKFGLPVDIAISNFGSIRLTQLLAGNVTRRKIFELMPLDNMLVLQRIKGNVLQQFLDFTAVNGGWPVAGISMKIKNKKAIDIMVNGQPLELGKIYVMAISDFVAGGGDNANMLKTIPQNNIGYLLRNALLDYVGILKKQGKSISAKEEKRVIYAE